MTTEQRIEKLENELIRAKRRNGILLLGACLLAVFLTLTWAGLGKLRPAYAKNTTPKEIRAKEFIVEDENGNARATLAVSKDGPALSLMHENGKPLAMLAVVKKGVMLTLCDINGKVRVMQSVSKDGSAVMKFYDENGKTRVGIMESVLLLLDENENRRVMLNEKNGGSSLALYGDGETLAGLTVLRGDEPKLFLTDENGNIVWRSTISK